MTATVKDLGHFPASDLALVWNLLAKKSIKRFSTKAIAWQRLKKAFSLDQIEKAFAKLGLITAKKAQPKADTPPVAVEKQTADEVIAHKKLNREQWLNKLAMAMIPQFNKLGYVLPRIAISCGFTSSGTRGTRIGECWHAKDGGIAEIFIKPDQVDQYEVAGILCHEMIHACLGSKVGHTKPFADAAKKLGLEGKPKSAGNGPEFQKWAKPLMEKIGGYPQEKLNCSPNIKAQKHPKMINMRCTNDGYFIKCSDFSLAMAVPKCPVCGDELLTAAERGMAH